jgi:DNA (cytosine-5)-methyltransferase 1
MPKQKLKLIDLFSGAGGLTLGFVRAGFKPIVSVESEKVFAQTYEANFGCHAFHGKIQDAMPQLRRLKADVVIGGPPCQGFSNLALNRPEDPRRTLWQYYMDVVESSDCSVFLMENVPNLLTSPEGAAILTRAHELGFRTDHRVVLASKFGVPQNRRRAFIIGSKIGSILVPEGNGETTTVRSAFQGIPLKPTVHDFPRAETPVPTSALHIARNPTLLSRKRYRLIPPGGNRFDLQRGAPELTPGCWIRKTKGGTDLYGRLEWDRPARCTVRTEFYKPEKGRYLHPAEHRPITHWEAARLQTFPDDFLWCGSKIEIAIQIGNAVPPKLSEFIARHIAANLNRHECGRKAKKHVRGRTPVLA